MVKKSKPSVKVESKVLDKEETIEVKEEIKASIKEEEKEGKGIEFYTIATGTGILIGLILIVFIILRYVLHMI